jgi:arabinoxylan arabinofuranohydrolase
MKKRLHIGLIITFLCIILLSGCQDKSTDNDISKSDNLTNNKNSTESEDSGQADNTAGKDDMIPTPADEESSAAEYKPSIENPAPLFNNIELAKAIKPIGYHNPLMTQRFGADPFAVVYGDRVYVYMTNDIVEYDASGSSKENTYGKINSLNVISSEDLVNWTDHGTIKVGGYGGGSIWANNSWAPAAIHKTINGKEQYFLYYANNASSIGVLQRVMRPSMSSVSTNDPRYSMTR